MTLVDTNVIFDILTNDKLREPWSSRQLQIASRAGRLVINEVIYAEISIRYESIEALEDALTAFGTELVPIPRAGLFLAAKAYRRYRSRGGTRTGVLSDFFIGAQAVVQDCALLTRDTGRYRHYFPGIRLIVPD